MLTAQSYLEFFGSTLQSTVFLERRMRLHVVRRDRLLFDTRFAPPARRATGNVHLFAQLFGTFEYEGHTISAPCAFVLDETEFDRVGPDSRTFRSYGERCTIVEMRIAPADILRPIGLANGPIDLPDEVWTAYHALAAEPVEAAVRPLIEALARHEILSRDLAANVFVEEPRHFRRVWSVMLPLYQQTLVSAQLKEITDLAGLSERQGGRDLRDLARTFGLFGYGFRDAMKLLRLRLCVLLLSSPDATPSDVAVATGYGSLDAMGRAFRDVYLQAPSLVRSAVRFR